MAEAALFLGWGTPARGREEAGIDVFNEAMVYWDGLKQEGKLEAIEVALLTPHGGLGGFALLRGTAQQIDSMRRSEEFKRLVNRVALRVDQLEVNRPGMSGDSICWEGWSYVSEFVEEVSAGAA